jgi:hypothetical protein
MIFDADLNPGLAAELPAAVRAARDGRPQPLLHVYQLEKLSGTADSADLSFALYLATVCRDGPFPWQPDTPIPDRPALLDAAFSALPAGSFGPFGSWARGFSVVDMCLNWPSPSGGALLGAGPFPDVPVLAVSGGLDLRTPTADAVSVVAHFPQGHLLTVPGVGHSVLTADPSGCSQRAVRSWIRGGTPPTTCARPHPYIDALASFPAPGAKHLRAAQTRAIAVRTLHEAEAAWLMTGGSSREAAVPGIYGGRLLTMRKAILLVDYSITPGVTLTGLVKLTKFGPPLVFKGVVTLGGAASARGTLELSGAGLRGKLTERR